MTQSTFWALLVVVMAVTVPACSPERNAAHRYCRLFKKCDEGGFKKEYGSVHECTKLLKLTAKSRNYSYKITESPECSRSAKKLDSCRARELDCDAFLEEDASAHDLENFADWTEDTADACKGESDDFEKECN